MTPSYAPQAGSFAAVVPVSSRNTSSISTSVVSSAMVQQAGAQPIPVRFNPQLIVDGNKESSSYDGLLQKQLSQQVPFIQHKMEISKLYYPSFFK